MAIPWAIAARRGQAINRLTATAQAISDKYDLEALPAVATPKTGQDPAISQMLQIEAFAGWLDELAAKLGIAGDDEAEFSAQGEKGTKAPAAAQKPAAAPTASKPAAPKPAAKA